MKYRCNLNNRRKYLLYVVWEEEAKISYLNSFWISFYKIWETIFILIPINSNITKSIIVNYLLNYGSIYNISFLYYQDKNIF